MTQPGHIEFRTAEEPVAGPGEILLRIKKSVFADPTSMSGTASIPTRRIQ